MQDLSVGDLGLGWDETNQALAAVQADLSRTVTDAPQLTLLWYDDSECNRRRAYVGKSVDWYFGAHGPFDLSSDYADSVFEIADKVQDAIADTMLGYFTAWPLCPVDGRLLTVKIADDGHACTWTCTYLGGHVVAEVGHLGAV